MHSHSLFVLVVVVQMQCASAAAPPCDLHLSMDAHSALSVTTKARGAVTPTPLLSYLACDAPLATAPSGMSTLLHVGVRSTARTRARACTLARTARLYMQTTTPQHSTRRVQHPHSARGASRQLSMRCANMRRRRCNWQLTPRTRCVPHTARPPWFPRLRHSLLRQSMHTLQSPPACIPWVARCWPLQVLARCPASVCELCSRCTPQAAQPPKRRS